MLHSWRDSPAPLAVFTALSTGDAAGIFIPTQAGLDKQVYQADIELQTWVMVGGTRGIFVYGAGTYLGGKLKLTTDGIATPNGSDNMMVLAYNGGIVDGWGYVNADQGAPLGTSNAPVFKALLQQFPINQIQSATDYRPAVWIRGAALKLGGTIPAGTVYRYASDMLPPLSNFRVRLVVQATGPFCQECALSTLDINTIMYAQQLSGYAYK